jgi:energy-coupling factor transporter ATP-binding protein EcfA2
MSKIIKLTSENVKRLQAVEISPQGNVIVIGGRNGQGKSSVLDSIQYALGGDPSAPMPVRRGEDKAKIVLDLGDLIVRRTFTAAGGTTLTVTNADGVRQVSPQAILDKLVGKLTFDPLEFARQKPALQAATLRQLVGINTTALDEEREKLYDERTNVNRDAKTLEARLGQLQKHEGVPDTETSTAEILAEQQKAADHNAANQNLRRIADQRKTVYQNAKDEADRTAEEIQRHKDEITRLESLHKQQTARATAEEANAKAAEDKAAAAVDEDLTPFREKAASAEAINQKIRDNRTRADVVRQFKVKTEQAEKLTAQIEAIDAKKRKTITDAKFPIDGMSFDAAGGVTLGGIPFEQCSSAEQLRVSVAIGLALNPKLRVLLIRDGSLLDEDSLKLMLEMAEKADAQVWLERVGDDATTSVVIEDGTVLEQETVEKAETAHSPNPKSSPTPKLPNSKTPQLFP